MVEFKGLMVREASNGCGYDKQDNKGNWSVYFTSSLNNIERAQLASLFK